MRINNRGKETIRYTSNETLVKRGQYELKMECVCREQMMSLYARVKTDDINEEVEMHDFELTTYSIAIDVIAKGRRQYSVELMAGLSFTSYLKGIKVIERLNISLKQAEESLANLPATNKTSYEKLAIIIESELEKADVPNTADFDRIKVSGIRSYIKKNKKELLNATYKKGSVEILTKSSVA